MRHVLFALVLLATWHASAEPSPEPSEQVAAPASRPAPANAVSISTPALGVRALSMSYERQGFFGLLGRLDGRFSLFTTLGVRGNTTGDYSAKTVATGGGLRYWFTGKTLWSSISERGMLGGYVGLRVGFGYTNVRDDIDDERIGATFTLSETTEVGYRFAPWARMEITPSLGIQLRHEIDVGNRLPPWTRASFTGGLSVGYLF